MSSKNGMYISSRWAHCLAGRKDTWSPGNSQPGEDTVTKQLLVDENEFSYIVSNTLLFGFRKPVVDALLFEPKKKKTGDGCSCWRLVLRKSILRKINIFLMHSCIIN